MALPSTLGELQQELNCPICLDPLQDPVSLHCGHNFCGACLAERWEDLQETLPCPLCLQSCSALGDQRNTQLRLLTDAIQQLSAASSGPQGRQEEQPICGEHGQLLTQFCEVDLDLRCAQCGISCERQGHLLTSIPAAAEQHRGQLKGTLASLQQKLLQATKEQACLEEQQQTLQERGHTRMTQLSKEFGSFKGSLGEEQSRLGAGLSRKLKEASQKALENREQLAARSSILQSLLGDITQKNSQGDQNLLLGIGQLHSQCHQSLQLEVPTALSCSQVSPSSVWDCRIPPHAVGLHNLMSKFQVPLTLDPDTAHWELKVCSQGRMAMFVVDVTHQGQGPRPQAFTSHRAVLASQALEGGRHFWLVQVRSTNSWALGVCEEAFPRTRGLPCLPSQGCWCYHKAGPPESPGHSPRVPPAYWGVFLDYELGEVSFFDLKERTHLCTLTGTFTGPLRPYFAVGSSSLPFFLRILEALPRRFSL